MAVHEFFTEVEQTDIDGLPEALQGKASQADLDTVEGRLDSHEAASDPHPQYIRDDQATAENSFGGVVQRDEFGGFGASYIYGLGIPNNGWDAASKEYVDALGSDTIAGGRVVRRASDGWFEASGIYGLETPTNNSHAATKGYVDGRGSVLADGNTFALRDESGGFVVNWLGVGAAPINGPDVTNKTYVDASDVAWANTKADLDHDHAIADVTGLQTALDGKQAAGLAFHVSNYATSGAADSTSGIASAFAAAAALTFWTAPDFYDGTTARARRPCVIFDTGIWNVSATTTIPLGVDVVIQNGAVVRAVGSMGPMFDTALNVVHQDGRFDCYGTIDCANLASVGIYLRSYARYTVHTPRVYSPAQHGVVLGDPASTANPYEAFVTDPHVWRPNGQAVPAGSIGIWVQKSTDSVIGGPGSVVVGCATGVRNDSSNNSFHSIHPWGYPPNAANSNNTALRPTVAFLDNSVGGNYVDCYADSPTQYGWRFTADNPRAALVNCRHYQPNITSPGVVSIQIDSATVGSVTVIGHVAWAESASNPIATDVAGTLTGSWMVGNRAQNVTTVNSTDFRLGGWLNATGSGIYNLATPNNDFDAATKKYVDDGLVGKLDDSQLGVANGVASLDASGLLPIAQLTSHAHDASDISQGTLSAARLPPRPFGTVTNTTTNTNAWNLDLSGAGIQLPLRLKWVLNHDTTFNVPTNPVGDGQLLRITGFANGGARVFNFAAGYVLSTGLSTRAIAIPSGKQMFASVEYSSDLAAWVLTACTVSA